MKKLLCLALLAVACGGSKYKAPPAVPSIALPTGAALTPFDATKPGVAHPQGIASLLDRAYVTLGNSDASTFTPRGPGFLASFVPSSGAVQLINLGGADGKQCLNPGSVRVFGAKLYVTCGGAFDGSGAAVVEVSSSGSVTRRLATPQLSAPFPHALSPYTLAATAGKLWVGDAASDAVRAIDLATFTLTSDAVALGCPQGSNANGNFPYSLVADLAISGGELYGLCGADVGGTSTLSRLDAATGALKQKVNVGPLPSAIAPLADGRIAVLNSNDNTLTAVTPGSSALTAQVALTFNSQTATLQDLRAFGDFVYTTASSSNTVQKIDPYAKGGAKVVGEVNVGQGANPYNILPLDDDQALVTNLTAGTVVSVKW